MKIKKYIYYLPSFVWLIFMFFMSSIKIVENGKERNLISDILYSIKIFLYKKHNDFLTFIANSLDKTYHAFEYFIFFLLLFFAIYKTYSMSLKKKYFITAIIGIGISTFDELHQLYIPSRFCSFTDFLADITGMFLMFAIIFFILFFRRQNEI